MQAQVTLKGTTDEAVTLSLAAFIAQNVLAGWDTDAPGQAAIVRALGYVPDEDERRALFNKIEYTAAELPPIRVQLGKVQMALPESDVAKVVEAVEELAAAGATIRPAVPSP